MKLGKEIDPLCSEHIGLGEKGTAISKAELKSR